MEASEEIRDKLVTSLSEFGGRLRVRNALNPILWLCGLTVPPYIIGSFFTERIPLIASLIVIAVVAVALFGFLYLLLKDKDRLQSEEYLIRRHTLELIEEKGSRKAIDAATVQAISQTEFLELSDPREEKSP